jgi:hypothetical protein
MGVGDVQSSSSVRGGGILEADNEPDFLCNAETDAAELDNTRRKFTEVVMAMGSPVASILVA